MACYQLILRYLCKALIKEKGLPVELEALVKDLWEIRMGLIQEYYVANETNASAGNAQYDSDAGESSGTEFRLYSSQTEGEGTSLDTEDEGGKISQYNQVRVERNYPSGLDSLALCYMAAMLLRLPLSVGDFYR
jgi:RNA polymerase I-specific transcription initiation factor RRN7